MQFHRTVRVARSLWWLLFLATACRQEELPPPAELQPLPVPAHFPAPRYDFAANKPIPAGIALGRKLFYDPITSVDSSISCASCHVQSLAFAHDQSLSRGVGGKLGLRNSPALQNLAWIPWFNADGGINHLDVQPLAPITDSAEHNFNLPDLFERLRRHPQYPADFEAAFGSRSISDRPFFLAMSQFMTQLVSASSHYDQVLTQKATFNADQAAGYSLFRTHCSSCHSEPLTSSFAFARNGHQSSTNDEGRKRVTGEAVDLGKFRIPSLRNVALTAPYMHDGSLPSLDAVLNHYTQPDYVADAPIGAGIALSQLEKNQLKAFLHSLTDPSFQQNEHLRSPFQP